MQNPVRSEEAAFRFLLLVIVYLGLIAIASIIATWIGLVAFVLETVAVVVWLLRARRKPGQAGDPDRRD